MKSSTSKPSSTEAKDRQDRLREACKRGLEYHEQQIHRYASEPSPKQSVEWVNGMIAYHGREIERMKLQLKMMED